MFEWSISTVLDMSVISRISSVCNVRARAPRLARVGFIICIVISKSTSEFQVDGGGSKKPARTSMKLLRNPHVPSRISLQPQIVPRSACQRTPCLQKRAQLNPRRSLKTSSTQFFRRNIERFGSQPANCAQAIALTAQTMKQLQPPHRLHRAAAELTLLYPTNS